MTSSLRPHDFSHFVKYAVLTWPEYFAVKILWAHDPNALLLITEAQAVTIKTESSQADAVKLSLLSQIVSEIAHGAILGLRDKQKSRLICSSNGLLKWMGLNALESHLVQPDGVRDVLRGMSSFGVQEKIQALGWMTNHFAGHPEKVTIFRGLVESLNKILPQTITKQNVNLLVDSLRSHMRRLGWCEPWLFDEVLFPLMAAKRIAPDHLCQIWTDEVVVYLEETLKDQRWYFQEER